MTIEEFITKYGTNSAGLMINALKERFEEQLTNDEYGQLQELAGDLLSALNEYAARPKK